jgi:hypothetical protein
MRPRTLIVLKSRSIVNQVSEAMITKRGLYNSGFARFGGYSLPKHELRKFNRVRSNWPKGGITDTEGLDLLLKTYED